MVMSDLQQELLSHSQRFEALLQEELDTLRNGGDADRLRELAEQKMDCSQSLENLDRYRRQQPDSPAPDSEVLESLRRCRDLNERIGHLLERRADYNEQAMQVLGLSTVPLRTYDAEGRRGANSYSRNLGEA